MKRLRNLVALAAATVLVLSVQPAIAGEEDGRSGALAYEEYPSGVVHLAIPDNNPAGVSDSIVVPGPGTVVDLDVALVVTHTWVGDLTVTLTHVDTGTAAVVIDRPGKPAVGLGCSGDDIDVVLDDEAPFPVEDECGALPAIGGTLSPNDALAVFDGEDMAGTWTLTVSDHQGADTGFLEEWTMYFGLQCGGLAATMIGTPGNDILVGTNGPDVIVGMGGNDQISGLGGDDTICGNDGSDRLDGGSGSDRLVGGDGKDRLLGGAGDDAIVGGPGKDTVLYTLAPGGVVVSLGAKAASGADGSDFINGVENVVGSFFDDRLVGSGKRNVLKGRDGDDVLIGKGQADRLLGQGGNDTLRGKAGDDLLKGGSGNDTALGGTGIDTCRAETESACEL